MEGQKEVVSARASCPHAQVQTQTQHMNFFKRAFAAEVAVCEDCGQTLWTAATHQRFGEWVVGLKREQRNAFQVQFYLTQGAHVGLEGMLSRFPGVPKSTLIRALTTVFLSAHVRLPSFHDISRSLIERNSYRSLAFGPRKKTSLQFSPMALLELQSRSDALKLAPNKIVEDAIFKLLALSGDEDFQLQELWAGELRAQLELILRSV